MKKIIVTTLAGLGLFVLTTSSYGQGQVQFQNNTASSPVTFGSGANSGSRIFGAAGTFEYGLYIGASTDTTLSQLTLVDTAQNLTSANGTSALAGLISGGTVTSPGNTASSFTFNAGTTYTVDIAVWTKADGADYLTALATGDLNGFFGTSGISTTVPTASPSPTDQLFGAGNAFPAGFSITAPVPEPSTIVLGGLGAAALLAFRRRK